MYRQQNTRRSAGRQCQQRTKQRGTDNRTLNLRHELAQHAFEQQRVEAAVVVRWGAGRLWPVVQHPAGTGQQETHSAWLANGACGRNSKTRPEDVQHARCIASTTICCAAHSTNNTHDMVLSSSALVSRTSPAFASPLPSLLPSTISTVSLTTAKMLRYCAQHEHDATHNSASALQRQHSNKKLG